MIKLKSTDSYRAKNAPLWNALRQNGIMLLTQPAAGGECALHIPFYCYLKPILQYPWKIWKNLYYILYKIIQKKDEILYFI